MPGEQTLCERAPDETRCEEGTYANPVPGGAPDSWSVEMASLAAFAEANVTSP